MRSAPSNQLDWNADPLIQQRVHTSKQKPVLTTPKKRSARQARMIFEGHTRRLFGRRPKRRSSVHTGTFQGTGMRGVWPVVVWRLNVRRIYWKIRKSVLNCMKVVNGPIPGQSLHMRFPGSPHSPPPAHREIVAAGPLLHRISPPTA